RPRRPRRRVPASGRPPRRRPVGRAACPGDGPAGMTTRTSSSWLRIRAVARRHAYVLQRSPHRLFDVTIWPLVDVLLFGSLGVFVAQGHNAPGRVAAAYLLSGILLWHVVYQSQIGLATGLLEETWSRNLLNLMVTPLREI